MKKLSSDARTELFGTVGLTLSGIIKSVGIPRNTHFVPRFYLSGFCDPGESKPRLWVYEKNKPIRKSAPSVEARQRDYYCLTRASEDTLHIEELLCKTETVAAPVLRKARSKGWIFTQSEKEELAFFIGQMFNRGPAAREFFKNNVDVLRSLLEDPERSRDPAFLALHNWVGTTTGVHLEPAELLGKLKSDELDPIAQRRRELFMLLRLTPLFAETFLKFRWQIWETNSDQLFITSDTPVISLRPRADGMADLGVGFLADKARVYFPLNLSKCLVMMQEGPEGRRTIPPSLVRMINRAILSCAMRCIFAPSRSPVLQKLVDRVGCRMVYGLNSFNEVEISVV